MPLQSQLRKSRLSLDTMEERLVPAFNLTIDGDVASNTNITVDTSTLPGTTIFRANASGAILDVDAIESALATGNVRITTGTGGAQAGTIQWLATSIGDDLDYFDAPIRDLRLVPDASSTVGSVTIDSIQFNLGDNLNLIIDTTSPTTDGAISFAMSFPVGLAGTYSMPRKSWHLWRAERSSWSVAVAVHPERTMFSLAGEI